MILAWDSLFNYVFDIAYDMHINLWCNQPAQDSFSFKIWLSVILEHNHGHCDLVNAR